MFAAGCDHVCAFKDVAMTGGKIFFKGFPKIEDYQMREISPNRLEGGSGKWLPNVRNTTGPLVSIITIVKNGESTIERTMKSVFAQTYSPIEYIVIDGGSTDGTVQLLKSHEHSISRWICEDDEGISDAFNKGISLASGEIIGIINADDWYEIDAVEKSVEALLSNAFAGFSFGGCVYYMQGKPSFVINGDAGYTKKVNKMIPNINHPTFFARRTVYESIGLYSKDWKLAMDYEFFLRCHRMGVVGVVINSVISHMSLGGVSSISFKKSLKECMMISIDYGRPKTSALVTYWSLVLKTETRVTLEKMGLSKLAHLIKRMINPNCSRA